MRKTGVPTNETAEGTKLVAHRFAEMFPRLDDRHREEMTENIREVGLIEDIVLLDGQILDGRERYDSCLSAGVTPRFTEYDNPMDPLEWVWARNYHRRDLTPDQKLAAAVAHTEQVRKEAQERMKRGVEQIPQGIVGRTRDIIAKKAGSNAKYADIAIKAMDQAPELINEMRDGKLNIHEVKARLDAGKGDVVGASKETSKNGPQSKFIGAVAAAIKAAGSVRVLRSSDIKHSHSLNKAINGLGFAFSQSLPLLLKSGDADAIELARKTIAILAAMPLDPGPEDPTHKKTVPAESSLVVAEVGTDMPNAQDCPVDTSALDWPTEPGLKAIIPARAMRLAIKRASLAAFTDEGQNVMSWVNGKPVSCIRIASTDDGLVFESGIIRYRCRHVLRASDGVAVIENGEFCVSAKELKSICDTLLRGADAISLSFVANPASDSQQTSPPVPNGMIWISAIRKNMIVTTVKVISYPSDDFLNSEAPSVDSMNVILSGKASTFKDICRQVTIAINPKDVNEILNKVALFDGGDLVYFVGTDSRRCAIASAKKSCFEKATDFGEYGEWPQAGAEGSPVVSKRPIPVLIDAEYLGPILAATNNGVVTIATDEAWEYVYLFCDNSAYRISRLDKDMAMKYPDYRRRLSMPIGAAILVDRHNCRTSLEMLRKTKNDGARYTFAPDDGIINITAMGLAAIKGADIKLAYKQVSGQPLKSPVIGLHTDYFFQAVKQMASENVKVSFSMDESIIRIEDELDPKFIYFMKFMNPSEVV